MTEDTRRCGFVALAGRPNVGKSTLVNRLIGSKISIVTPKPQTTRHRIVGVRNDGDTQFLFVDTPGLQAGRQSLMAQTMNRSAESSMADADVVLFVVDSSGLTPADEHVLETIKRHDVPIVAVLNKIDRWRRSTARTSMSCSRFCAQRCRRGRGSTRTTSSATAAMRFAPAN